MIDSVLSRTKLKPRWVWAGMLSPFDPHYVEPSSIQLPQESYKEISVGNGGDQPSPPQPAGRKRRKWRGQ